MSGATRYCPPSRDASRRAATGQLRRATLSGSWAPLRVSLQQVMGLQRRHCSRGSARLEASGAGGPRANGGFPAARGAWGLLGKRCGSLLAAGRCWLPAELALAAACSVGSGGWTVSSSGGCLWCATACVGRAAPWLLPWGGGAALFHGAAAAAAAAGGDFQPSPSAHVFLHLRFFHPPFSD